MTERVRNRFEFEKFSYFRHNSFWHYFEKKKIEVENNLLSILLSKILGCTVSVKYPLSILNQVTIIPIKNYLFRIFSKFKFYKKKTNVHYFLLPTNLCLDYLLLNFTRIRSHCKFMFFTEKKKINNIVHIVSTRLYCLVVICISKG